MDTSRLWISEYFSELINKLDINTEALLMSDSINLEMKNKINSIRYEYLSEITQTRNQVLCNLDFGTKTVDRVEEFDHETLNKIFYKFCFLIDSDDLIELLDCKHKLGFLIISDFYFSQAEIDGLTYRFLFMFF